jgi:hypothetical protein
MENVSTADSALTLTASCRLGNLDAFVNADLCGSVFNCL